MKILPRGPETDRGLLKATQQGQVSQGLPLHIWLMSLQYLFYPGAVNSWKDGLPFEYTCPWRGSAGLQMSVRKHMGTRCPEIEPQPGAGAWILLAHIWGADQSLPNSLFRRLPLWG